MATESTLILYISKSWIANIIQNSYVITLSIRKVTVGCFLGLSVHLLKKSTKPCT